MSCSRLTSANRVIRGNYLSLYLFFVSWATCVIRFKYGDTELSSVQGLNRLPELSNIDLRDTVLISVIHFVLL